MLGYKFAKQGAFGLSLVPCDRETLLHVREVSRKMVLAGYPAWPGYPGAGGGVQ